ncbi:MAG: aspartyl-phosphate phosphatase Spo0E family protein [Desulfuromonadaceae bacterium]
MLESLRQIMVAAVERYGLDDPWVLQISQRLDLLINQYYREV